MLRRNVSAALVAMIALQLLGGMVFASICLDPCPDDGEGTSCPPVCAVCTSCAHGQTAIVQPSASGTPFLSTARFHAPRPGATSFQLADDIFHVPLFG